MVRLQVGGGFLATLTLIFVIAKIWGYINWSWWLVFLPVIIGASIVLLVLAFLCIMFFLAWISGGIK